MVVVVVVVVVLFFSVCVSAQSGRSLGIADQMPAVSTRGLPPELQKIRSVVGPASDLHQPLLCQDLEDPLP